MAQQMQAQQQRAASWYGATRRRAEKLIAAGDYDEAEQVLLRLRAVRPNDRHVRRLLQLARADGELPLPRPRPRRSTPPAPTRRRGSLMSFASLVVSFLGVMLTALQVGHDVFGMSFSPIEAAQDLVERVRDEVDPPPELPVSEVSVPGVDTTPPTAPQNLRVVGQEGCTATLAWDPSSDDVGVTRYRIYQDGRFAGSTDGTITQADVPFLSGQDHTFTVQASDGLNDSEQSNAVTVPACTFGDF